MLVNLNAVLADAQQNHYAVGLFNTTDTDMLEGVISAAEECRSPVIIGTAEVLLPNGELKLIAPSIIAAAKRATIPVVVHYDHGLTFDRCMEALQLGFSSIMFDGSAGAYDKNIADTREIVKIAHAFGATVEGEIGHVGEASAEDNDATDLYTRVDEAEAYLKATGVDALAVSIGTAHGAYKSKPKLDFERLAALRAALPVPLVLHGGSGLSDDDFRTSIAKGIAKVNIFTDLCLAGNRAMSEGLSAGEAYLTIRNRKVEAIKQSVVEKMKLFGSVNRG
ncbi:MAG: class II fructose-bisphosphate aldolase [Clostridia bacterium]|nr:class II fructose-bisphosphate aldolase [Clostridia bacterium]